MTLTTPPPAGGLAFHPFAELFPLIEGEAFEELVADVRENGLREEIVLLDGMILDGRNRYRAALAAGVKPVMVDFTGPWAPLMFVGLDPLAWVLSKNLHRRHLTDGQRVMIAAEIATMRQGRPSLWRDGLEHAGDNPANWPDSEKRAAAPTQAEAAKMLGVSERQVRRGRQVFEAGAPEVIEAAKRGDIAPSAAAEISKLPVGEQLRILRDGVDPRALRQLVKEQRAEQQQQKRERRDEREADLGKKQSALPVAKFGVIYADPEWQFEPYSRASGMDRAADNHYPTSGLEAIKARDVGSLAAPDCVLFLWATAPMLPHALEVMAAWGFAYKSHIVWRKAETHAAGLVLGTGYWFRNAHELLLVGTRGGVPAPAAGTQWASMADAPPRKHSEKPDWAYELIEAYFPTLPKIELNARQARDGWAKWGYEAPEDESQADTQRGSGTAREAPGSPAPESQKADGIADLSEDQRLTSAGEPAAQSASAAVEQEGAQPAPPHHSDEPGDPAVADAAPSPVAASAFSSDVPVASPSAEVVAGETIPSASPVAAYGALIAADMFKGRHSKDTAEPILRAAYAAAPIIPPKQIAEDLGAKHNTVLSWAFRLGLSDISRRADNQFKPAGGRQGAMP